MIKQPLTEIKLEMEHVEKFKAYLAQSEHQSSIGSGTRQNSATGPPKPTVKTSLFGGGGGNSSRAANRNLDSSFGPFTDTPGTRMRSQMNIDSPGAVAGSRRTTGASSSLSPAPLPIDTDHPSSSFIERLRRETYPDVPAFTPGGAVSSNRGVAASREFRLGILAFTPEVMGQGANTTPGTGGVSLYR